MKFSGKLIKEHAFIHPIGIDLDKDLDYWIQLSLDYNLLAKSS